MSTDKTLADVQPGGMVRLGDQAERARFEAWAISRGWSIQRWAEGAHRYCNCDTEKMWEAFQAALSAQPSPGGQGDAVLRAINSKDLYQVLMDVQNGIDSPALASMANGAIQLIDKARVALAARQPVELIAQKVGDYRVTVAEDAITVSHGRDIVFAYSAGDAEPIIAHPPAQETAKAVDLGQFRPFVEAQRAEYISHGLTEEDYCVAECDDLLALIDSNSNS